jgi:hypothetical protein
MAEKAKIKVMRNLKISPAVDNRLTRFVKKKFNGRVYGNKSAEAERLIDTGIKREQNKS